VNARRFFASALGVWIVRVVLNGTFYTHIVRKQYDQIAFGHPGMYRAVVPAFIAADLVFAFAFAYLYARVGVALGGGATGGVKLGLIVAVLSPIIGQVYQYYSFTFLPPSLVIKDVVFQTLAHAIQGATAGLIYKTKVENV
jgi:hypothetical protein